jgi:hypothetical protein
MKSTIAAIAVTLAMAGSAFAQNGLPSGSYQSESCPGVAVLGYKCNGTWAVPLTPEERAVAKKDACLKDYAAHPWFVTVVSLDATGAATAVNRQVIDGGIACSGGASTASGASTKTIDNVSQSLLDDARKMSKDSKTLTRQGFDDLRRNQAAADTACASGSTSACTEALTKMAEDAQSNAQAQVDALTDNVQQYLNDSNAAIDAEEAAEAADEQ